MPESASALNCRHFTGNPPGCYVCLPLGAQGDLIGMLHLQRSGAPSLPAAFAESELNLMRDAAQHIALAVANLGLREALLERATHRAPEFASAAA